MSSTKYWTQNLLVGCIICLHLKLVNKNYINFTWQESSTLMITSQNEEMDNNSWLLQDFKTLKP